MSIGIYKIENITNGKVYIGSSKQIEKRWQQHKRQLTQGNHHSVKLQRAWNKYGECNFTFSILEECDVDRILYLEQYYIDKYGSYFEGYNSKEKTKEMVTEEDYFRMRENSYYANYIYSFQEKICLGFTDKRTDFRIENGRYKYDNERLWYIDIINFVLEYANDTECLYILNNNNYDKNCFIDFEEKNDSLMFLLFYPNNILLKFKYIPSRRMIILYKTYKKDTYRYIFKNECYFNNDISDRYLGFLYDCDNEKREYCTDQYFKIFTELYFYKLREIYEKMFSHRQDFMTEIDEYYKRNNIKYSKITIS